MIVFLSIIIIVLGATIGQTKMPNVLGLTPYEAKKQIETLSGDRIVSIVTSEDEQVTITGENSYSEYIVVATDPNAGEILANNGSDQKITITIKKAGTPAVDQRPNTTQGPVNEESSVELSMVDQGAFLQTQVDGFIDEGWAEVKYSVADNAIVIDFIQSPAGYPSWKETLEEQEWKDCYLANADLIARTLNSNIMFAFYSNDNELYYSLFASKPE